MGYPIDIPDDLPLMAKLALKALNKQEAQLGAELDALGLPDLDDIDDIENFDFTADYPPVLKAICNNEGAARLAAVQTAIGDGADVNTASSFGETATDMAFQSGAWDVLALLAENGADLSKDGWNPLHIAVMCGDMAAVILTVNAETLAKHDNAGRTPYLMACRIGALEKAHYLRGLSAPEAFESPDDGETELHIAARSGSTELVAWLLSLGLDINTRDDFGGTPLLVAVQYDHSDIASLLIDNGADVSLGKNLSQSNAQNTTNGGGIFGMAANLIMKSTAGLMPEMEDTIIRPADSASSPQMRLLLLQNGADLNDFESENLPELIGANLIAAENITLQIFAEQRSAIPGTSNPQVMDMAFWRQQVRSGQSGFTARSDILKNDDIEHGQPVWSFSRFGRSATRLPDGTWVLIAGEHADSYDVDFCIYNDVTVLDGKGNVTIYGYPTDIFPPTDFHTATLLGDRIILIGNLGYQGQRPEGQTQVLSLSLADYSITRLQTTGSNPGWISRHRAELHGKIIRITGGKLEPGFTDNTDSFVLDIKSLIWSRSN